MACAAMVVPTGPGQAQDATPIPGLTGTATNPDGTPAIAAVVDLFAVDPTSQELAGHLGRVATDAQGHFALKVPYYEEMVDLAAENEGVLPVLGLISDVDTSASTYQAGFVGAMRVPADPCSAVAADAVPWGGVTDLDYAVGYITVRSLAGSAMLSASQDGTLASAAAAVEHQVQSRSAPRWTPCATATSTIVGGDDSPLLAVAPLGDGPDLVMNSSSGFRSSDVCDTGSLCEQVAQTVMDEVNAAVVAANKCVHMTPGTLCPRAIEIAKDTVQPWVINVQDCAAFAYGTECWVLRELAKDEVRIAQELVADCQSTSPNFIACSAAKDEVAVVSSAVQKCVAMYPGTLCPGTIAFVEGLIYTVLAAEQDCASGRTSACNTILEEIGTLTTAAQKCVSMTPGTLCPGAVAFAESAVHTVQGLIMDTLNQIVTGPVPVPQIAGSTGLDTDYLTGNEDTSDPDLVPPFGVTYQDVASLDLNSDLSDTVPGVAAAPGGDGSSSVQNCKVRNSHIFPQEGGPSKPFVDYEADYILYKCEDYDSKWNYFILDWRGHISAAYNYQDQAVTTIWRYKFRSEYLGYPLGGFFFNDDPDVNESPSDGSTIHYHVGVNVGVAEAGFDGQYTFKSGEKIHPFMNKTNYNLYHVSWIANSRDGQMGRFVDGGGVALKAPAGENVPNDLRSSIQIWTCVEDRNTNQYCDR